MSAPFIVTKDGVEYSFPMLSPAEIQTLQATYCARRSARVKKLGAEEGLKGEAMAKFRGMVELDDIALEELWLWADKINGATEITKVALKKSGKTDAEILEIQTTIGSRDLWEPARRVLDWKPPEKPEGKQNPNPPQGSAGESSTSSTDGS